MKRKYKLKLFVYVLILVGIIGFLSFSCFSTWKTIYENRRLKVELEEKYNKLVDKEETLTEEVTRLQDPEYIAKYAREKYKYSKEDELIIDIIDEDEWFEK